MILHFNQLKSKDVSRKAAKALRTATTLLWLNLPLRLCEKVCSRGFCLVLIVPRIEARPGQGFTRSVLRQSLSDVISNREKTKPLF